MGTGYDTDRTSGSGDVALGFLEALERFCATDTSRTATELRVALLVWLREAQSSQPSMALIHQLAARAWEIAGTGAASNAPPVEIRDSIVRSCAAEREDLAANLRGVAQTALKLLVEPEPWIATLSASRAVREAFVAGRDAGLKPRALVGEGRPGREGRATAAALAAAGIPAWVVVDAALPMLSAGARMVWLGADAVTDRGVLNKIGSYALALAAREHAVPVYVLAGRRKFLPSATAALRIREMPPEEVWRDPPEGVRARNVYFELVPFDLIRGVVVEDGVLGPSEAKTTALERALPEELAKA